MKNKVKFIIVVICITFFAGNLPAKVSAVLNSGNIVVPIDISSGASSNYLLEIVSESGTAYGSFVVK